MSTIPLSGTNIRLLSGIPFNSDYKNTRWFDSLTEQTNWFLSRNVVHSISEANFQRIEGHTFISVNKSIDELWNAGYVMFQNASYNNKWFYGFVTKLEYVQRNTTYVHFEIDVMQTWVFNVRFLPSFVVREHDTQYNTDGTPSINTLDEGLNYGTEYDVVRVDQCRAYNDLFFLVVVSKSAMHDTNATVKIEPNINALPQPLTYYVHPFKLDGTSPVIQTTGDFGQTVNASNIIDILTGIMTQSSAVNDVVSLYVTDYFGYNANYDGTNISFDGNKFKPVTIGSITTICVTNLTQYEPRIINMGYKYAYCTITGESKLMMSPYTILTLDDFKGNRVTLKNEYINGTDIMVSIKGSLGTSNKVSYSIDNYLQDSNATYSTITGLEHAVINNNPNDIPIINDMLASYLQGNRNSIANQKAQIGFNGMIGAMKSFVGVGQAVIDKNPLGGVNAGLEGVQSVGNAYYDTQALMAKQQDIANVPPSLNSMGSNSNFDYGNGIYGLYLIKKQIKPEYMKKLDDFFKMYGYKKNEVKLPNVHTRQNWNYIQTKGIILTSDINNQDLQILKNIFDNGVTLWHTDDIGNYGLQNGVI